MAASQGTTVSFVIFRLGDEEYGLSAADVNSIIRYEQPTPMPRAPESVMGVINLRGRVIPVVDLLRRFRGESFTPRPMSRIVVSDGSTGSIGLAVDSASEVAEVLEEDIRPVPEGILSPDTARSFYGVVERNGSLVILIDLEEAVPQAGFVASVDEGVGEGETNV